MQFGNDPLSWLLAPESLDVFLEEYFNQKHYVCRNADRERFSSILSFEVLDEVLGTYGLVFPEIRLAQLDKDVPPEEYVQSNNRIDPLRVGRLFSEGATVIYRSLQHRHQPVQLLCSALAEQASIQTQANIYLTPPHSQGFKIHWDTHDVFIIQIEGSKIWRIHDGGIPIPIKTQKFDSAKDEPGEVIDEFTLNAGDVLYIPRGLMHAAASTDQASLHITLGFLGYSWAELLIDALGEHIDKDPLWRENLPFGYAQNGAIDFASMRKKLSGMLDTFIDQVDIEPLLAAHIWKVRDASRPREKHYMANAMNAKALKDTQQVARIPGIHIAIKQHDGRVIVSGGARELQFPEIARRTIETALNGVPIYIAELDNDLDLESRKTVISKLIREGLLKAV